MQFLGLGFQLFWDFFSFSSLFYIFSSFLEFLDIFRGKEGFMAFWRHSKPFGGFFAWFYGFFDGNMVGKWTMSHVMG